MKINQQTPLAIPSRGDGGEMGATLVRVDESTLQQVADRLKLLLELLTAANPQISNPNQLTPGQEVRYPLHPFARPEMQKPAETAVNTVASGDRDVSRDIEAAGRRQELSSGGMKRASIPAYDPRKGPQITNDMWTDEMLTGDLSENQLRNMVDPAGFLNARVERLRRPTTAVFRNSNGSVSPVNVQQMSTRDDAEAMLVRLRALGLPVGEIVQPSMSNPFSFLDYGDDPRRHFEIAGMNVGLLLERYAKYPREAADRMTLAEFGQGRG
ncbi:MAG: hypothetical protein R2729_28060 [Bryobacteraceae bacterium]